MFAVHLRNPCLVVSGRESNLAEKSEKTNQAVQSAPEFRDVHALLAHYPRSHDLGEYHGTNWSQLFQHNDVEGV